MPNLRPTHCGTTRKTERSNPPAQLRQLAADGRLRPTDMVWRDGMPQWGPAGHVTGLFPAAVLPPPVLGAPMNYYGQPPGYSAPDIGQDVGMRMLLPVGRSGWAIAAGYLGLFSFVIFPAPFALIISIIAILDIKKHPDRHGMGRAIFGLVMGIIGTGLLLLWVVVMVAGLATGQIKR